MNIALSLHRKLGIGIVVALMSIQLITFYTSYKSHRRVLQNEPNKLIGHPISSKCLYSTPRFGGIKVFSQNDEDGILLHLLRCMGGHGNREFFEFGVYDGMQCNTRILREHYDWKGHILDGGFEKPEINLHKEWFTPTNIIKLLEKYGVSKTVDVLSVDTDGDDFWMTREILRSGYRPRILIVEYNPDIPPHLPITALPKEVGQETEQLYWGCYYGAGAAAFNKLTRAFGYTLVHSNRVNLFFVQFERAKNQGLAIPSMDDVVPPLEVRGGPKLWGKDCAPKETFPARNNWVLLNDFAIARCHHQMIDHATLKHLLSNNTVTYEVSESSGYRFFKGSS